MKYLMKNIKLLPVFLIVIGTIACEEEDAKLPKIKAGFTFTLNSNTGLVTFINTSENANTYQWDFGDKTSSTEINPTKTYKTGTYTVILKASNVAGSSATFQDKVLINIPIPVRLPISFDETNVKYGEFKAFNGTSFEVVDNPDVSGANATASKVGKLTNSGANWEGFYYNLDASVDLSTDKTIKMKVWAKAPVPVTLKLEEGTTAAVEMVVTHGGTGWEELIFTFDSSASYKRLTVFVDGPGKTTGAFYFDDIRQTKTVDVTPPVITLKGNTSMTVDKGSKFTDPGATATDNIDGDISAKIVVGGDKVDTNTTGKYSITYNVSDAAGNAAKEVKRTVEVTQPSTSPKTSAPVPPARNTTDVISIYGETYTNIKVGNYDPNWGQSGHGKVNTSFNPGDGNLALGYLNFNYQGTDFGAGGPVDASAMEFFHLDIWVASGTQRMVKVSPINNSGKKEVLVEVPVKPGSWNSVDLPKSAFTGMTWNSLVQLKFDGQFNTDGSPNSTPYDIYLDNIYFYKAPTSGRNVVSIFHDNYTDIAINAWGPDWGPASARIVDGTLKGSPAKVIKMESGKVFTGIDFTKSAFDATNYKTFHIEYKVDVLLAGQVFNIKLSNHNGGKGETSAIQYTHTPTSTDVNTLSIALADFVAASNPSNLARNAIAQIVISAARADTKKAVNITIDSIYFSK